MSVRFEIGTVLGLEFRWNRSVPCLDQNFREEFGIERSDFVGIEKSFRNEFGIESLVSFFFFFEK